MLPNSFSVFPTSDDSTFDGVSKLECLPFGLDDIFSQNYAIVVLIFIPANKRREFNTWLVCTWKPCFYHSRSIIYNNGNTFLFLHFSRFIIGFIFIKYALSYGLIDICKWN